MRRILWKIKDNDLYISQTRKVFILGNAGGLPWLHTQQKQDSNGPSQVKRNRTMDNTNNHQASMIIFGIWKLVQEAHQGLWKSDKTTQQTTEEGQEIQMDR